MRALLGLALLILHVAAQSQEPISSPSKTGQLQQSRTLGTKQNAAKNHLGTDEKPLSIRLTNTGKGKDEIEREVESEKHKGVREWWLNIFTGIAAGASLMLAVITAVLAYFTYGLWKDTGKLVRETTQTAERQLRAYLSAVPDYIYDFDTNTPAHIRFTVINHGQTPALDMRYSAFVDICPYPLPNSYPFPESLASAPSQSVIHPSASIYGNTTASRYFSSTEIAQVVAGKNHRIYIFGEMKYLDIFKHERTTRFCSSIVGDKNLASVATGQSKSVEIKFEPAGQHNHAT